MDIKIGLYKHFKGDFYIVLCNAIHTETGEQLVVYTSAEGLLFNERLMINQENLEKFGYNIKDPKIDYPLNFVSIVNNLKKKIYTRPLRMFQDAVEYNGESVPRFELIEEA